VLNRFNVLNDPVNLIDPWGFESILPDAGFPEHNPIGTGRIIGGLSLRGNLLNIGGEGGFMGIFGQEGSNYNLQASIYDEAFAGGGLSIGRGPWIGFWTGDSSDIACADEIGIDLPIFGTYSVLYDLNIPPFLNLCLKRLIELHYMVL
jgi:hypothetical protein